MIHLQHTHTKVSSDIIITDENNNTHYRECLKCVHCQHIWIVKRGSGRKRGWCLKCMGPTCGSQSCMECVPLDVSLNYD